MAHATELFGACTRCQLLVALVAIMAPPGPSAQPVGNAAQLRTQVQSAPPSRVVSLATPAGQAPPPARPSQQLSAGQAHIKQLPPELDAATAALIRERLLKQPTPTRGIASNAASLKFFSGAAEILAQGSGERLTLRALALADAPLRYDPTKRRFRGSIELGVVEIAPSGSVQNLSAPVDFQVLGVAADPNRVQARRTAPPFETVAVEVADPDGPAVSVRVRSALSPDKDETLELQVDRPSLEITASPTVIQGWGLETAVVTVHATESDVGRPALQLSTKIGRLADSRLILDEHGMATVSLRSASIGTDRIAVRGSPFSGAEVDVVYSMPVRFIVAAVIGGLAGGLLRLGKRIRANRATARELALGVLAGIVVFGLYALGVNLTGFHLPAQAGEVLVFVVAAIGAFVGAKLLMPPPTT